MEGWAAWAMGKLPDGSQGPAPLSCGEGPRRGEGGRPQGCRLPHPWCRVPDPASPCKVTLGLYLKGRAPGPVLLPTTPLPGSGSNGQTDVAPLPRPHPLQPSSVIWKCRKWDYPGTDVHKRGEMEKRQRGRLPLITSAGLGVRSPPHCGAAPNPPSPTTRLIETELILCEVHL